MNFEVLPKKEFSGRDKLGTKKSSKHIDSDILIYISKHLLNAFQGSLKFPNRINAVFEKLGVIFLTLSRI